MFIIATISCFLVVLSLVHFLMALSANYAHIRGHDKFTELQVHSNNFSKRDRFARFPISSCFFYWLYFISFWRYCVVPCLFLFLKVLSSEMDPAEIRFIL
jgi:hypothetical protein